MSSSNLRKCSCSPWPLAKTKNPTHTNTEYIFVTKPDIRELNKSLTFTYSVYNFTQTKVQKNTIG